MIIPLGKVGRAHGVSKESSFAYKVELFDKSSEWLSTQKTFYIQSEKEWVLLELLSPPESSGAKWGTSRALIIRVKQSLDAGSILGLARESFPSLSNGEYYLCDVIHKTVTDTQQTKIIGKVVGYAGDARGMSVYFQIQTPDGLYFDVPSHLVLANSIQSESLVISDIQDWMQAEFLRKVL